SYAIANTGSTGPSLRGAIQTAANGGNIADDRLSGSGVTAQNFGPVAPSEQTAPFEVIFTPTGGGALDSQRIAIVNNFDDVPSQLLTIEGRAIVPAAGQLSTTSLNFGTVRTTDAAPTREIDVSNVAPAGDFSEALGITVSPSSSSDFSVSDTDEGTPVAPGTTADGRIRVTLDNRTAGQKSGDFSVSYTTLALSGSSLTDAPVGSDSVDLLATVEQAAVFVTAAPEFDPEALNFGDFRLGSTPSSVERQLTIRNAATGPEGFVDRLAGTIEATGAAFSGSGNLGDGLASEAGTTVTFAFDTSEAGVFEGETVADFTSENDALDPLELDVAPVALSGRVFTPAAGQLSTTSLDFGPVRTSDAAPSRTIDVSNVAPAAVTSEALGITVGTSSSSDFSVVDTDEGAPIAAGTTADDRIAVTLDNSSAGTKTGTFSVDYTTLAAAGSSLANASVGSDSVDLAAEVTIDVFQTAQPDFDPEGLDFGVHRVGSGTVERALTVTNTATGEEGFVDRLIGSMQGTGPRFGGGGELGDGLGGGVSTTLAFSFDTSEAGIFSGEAVANFSSDNDVMDPVKLDIPPVAMTGQVNNLANPVYQIVEGDGVLSRLGDGTFLLDLGEVLVGDGPLNATLSLANLRENPAMPQDDLGGSFRIVDVMSAFGFGGFDPFEDVAAGEALDGLTIEFDPAANGLGRFTSVANLLGLSTFSGLEDLVLGSGVGRLQVEAVVTPIPGSVLLFGSGLAGLAVWNRRRKAMSSRLDA
ncbi:MAG: choice-of-anchor D domain-containing protein, partial [Pseudomonadota bacterium]